MDPETAHRLIHCNFQQLHLLHPASFTFEEGMFKVPNKKGFENAMHYLLNIVDPVKCAKRIPWPLLDKKGESQFRIAVKMFLMEVNSDYPEANLPNVVSSFFMSPGGDKFAYFMWKLTKFVLLRSLRQTYGTSDILLPPRTFVNDPMASAKLRLLHAMVESETQKAVSNQLKLDSLLSQEFERQCHIQLSELAKAVTKYENLLKELIKDSLVSTEIKEKLCRNFDDTNVIAEWVGVVEAEGRVFEAIIHVLNKIGNSVTNLLETIKHAEDSDTSQLRLDPSSLNICAVGIDSMADDLKELMKNAQSGKLSVSEFIESLTRSQTSLIQHIVNNGLQDMSTVLPDLGCVNDEFKELAVILGNVEAQLQETLNRAQNSCEVLHKELKTLKFEPADKTEVSSSIDSAVPDGASGEDVYITDPTPDWDVTRNVCSKHTKNKTVANIKIDPQLIQTPEFDRKFDGPLHLSDASGPRREYETPVRKHNYTLPATTSKKSQSTDLRSLTNSLVRKKKAAGTSTQFQSVPRSVPHLYKKGHKTRAAPAANKELFKKCVEDTEKKSGQSEEFSTLSPLCESFSVKNANEDHVLPSCVPEDGSRSSPSSMLCSPEPAEAEQQTNKKGNRRKSLNNLIERYRKIRQNMDSS